MPKQVRHDPKGSASFPTPNRLVILGLFCDEQLQHHIVFLNWFISVDVFISLLFSDSACHAELVSASKARLYLPVQKYY